MAFASYRAITIPAANIPASQTDFPLLFLGTYAFLIDAAHGGTVRSTVGNDIVFSSNTAGTAILDFERVFYRASDGYCEFKIRTQPVAGVDYILYVCFDDATVASYLGNDHGTWGAPWRAVYHFGDGVTLSGADSTANTNTGTISGGPAAVSGQITGGISFTAAANRISMSNRSSLSVATPFAIRCWVKLTSYNASDTLLMAHLDGLGNYNYILGTQAGTGKPRFQWVNGSFQPNIVCPTAIPLNTWTQVTWVITGTTSVSFYINGSLSNTQTSIISVPGMTTSLFTEIGSDGSSGNQIDGALDELGVYSGTHSASLIAMLYANEFSPATFYNVTANVAWTSTCTIAIVVGSSAHGTMGYSPSCSIPIGIGCGAGSSIGYGGASCKITIGGGVAAHGTMDYESPTCKIPIVVGVGAIASIGTVPFTCVTGSGTGGAVISPTFDPGFAY